LQKFLFLAAKEDWCCTHTLAVAGLCELSTAAVAVAAAVAAFDENDNNKTPLKE